MKRHFSNRLRLRDKQKGPRNSEIHQQLTTSAHNAEETVIPELVFPATQGSVREPPIRVQHHSLSRLKHINTCTDVRLNLSCPSPYRASERIACEQALLFGRAKRASRERASERRSCKGTPLSLFLSRASWTSTFFYIPQMESLLAG